MSAMCSRVSYYITALCCIALALAAATHAMPTIPTNTSTSSIGSGRRPTIEYERFELDITSGTFPRPIPVPHQARRPNGFGRAPTIDPAMSSEEVMRLCFVPLTHTSGTTSSTNLSADEQPAQEPDSPQRRSVMQMVWSKELFKRFRYSMRIELDPQRTVLRGTDYIKITSLRDGYTQIHTAETLPRWEHTSAYFNGPKILVELFVDACNFEGTIPSSVDLFDTTPERFRRKLLAPLRPGLSRGASDARRAATTDAQRETNTVAGGDDSPIASDDFGTVHPRGSSVVIRSMVVNVPCRNPGQDDTSEGDGGDVCSFPANSSLDGNDDIQLMDICDETDTRTPSSDNRVGRLMPSACTTFRVRKDTHLLYLTAGHCALGNAILPVVEHNVPPSLDIASLQHPPPEFQIPIERDSWLGLDYSIGEDDVDGNDWAVFLCNQTATSEAVSAVLDDDAAFELADEPFSHYISAVNATPPMELRVTGYGVADGVLHQTQQTAVGPLVNATTDPALGTYRLVYRVDTRGGNSGSPVIDNATGKVIAIHNTGGCSPGALGGNVGTWTGNPRLLAAVNKLVEL